MKMTQDRALAIAASAWNVYEAFQAKGDDTRQLPSTIYRKSQTEVLRRLEYYRLRAEKSPQRTLYAHHEVAAAREVIVTM